MSGEIMEQIESDTLLPIEKQYEKTVLKKESPLML